jgi:hypothetical protein
MDWQFMAPRTGYWLEDERDFLVEEFSVNAMGDVKATLADVSQSELFSYQMADLWGGLKAGGEPQPRPRPYFAMNHPNWNYETNTYNPPGPSGDQNGYWTEPEPGVYVWVHQEGLPGQPP